jgi:hypothetical protein
MILCTANNPNLPFSPYTLKYFPRILQRCLNTFRVFSVYAERMKNTQKEIFFQQCPGTLKGQCFKKIEWGVICLRRVNNLQYFFWLSLKQKLLYAYMENTLNGETSTESVYISVINNTNFKKFRFFLYTLYGIELA